MFQNRKLEKLAISEKSQGRIAAESTLILLLRTENSREWCFCLRQGDTGINKESIGGKRERCGCSWVSYPDVCSSVREGIVQEFEGMPCRIGAMSVYQLRERDYLHNKSEQPYRPEDSSRDADPQ